MHYQCPATGCLYNVVTDMREEHEISAQFPGVVATMQAEFTKWKATMWSTSHKNDPACKVAAHARWGGFYGPWKEL